MFDTQWSKGTTKFTIRYADNADNSTFDKMEDLTTLYSSLQGNFKVSEKWDTEFLVSYHDDKNDGTETTNTMVQTLAVAQVTAPLSAMSLESDSQMRSEFWLILA